MRKTTFLKKNQKKFHKYLAERKNSRTFATAKENQAGHLARRDGRVVDYNGLENRRTERYRGFESLSLRSKQRSYLIIRKLRCFSFFSCARYAPLSLYFRLLRN